MNLKSNRNQVKAEANMASISDLVFLLLIFFILLSTMIKPGIPVDPPSGKSGMMDNKPLTVSVDEKIDFYIGNDRVTKETLESKLHEKLDGKKDTDKAFLLNIDKSVPSEYLVFVLDIANQNKWKVGIGTKNE